MQETEFQELVKQASSMGSLPEALAFLKNCDLEDVASAAKDLTGQFALAEMEGVNKIYHVITEKDEQGNEEELLEFIMNEGDDTLIFVAWFFSSQFSLKTRDVYRAAGKTYKQPKRS
ncbi:hypothetical protein [Vibrio salinus]|uniref:hypothetical protein n=1 Tax=Vibrio salinus TaxID=2899784 RepID=UPI001E2855A9|nr:hypothetical protein [Vibrio salinus]MCE0494946.1 hypothetical protein [Vibrio salinus]